MSPWDGFETRGESGSRASAEVLGKAPGGLNSPPALEPIAFHPAVESAAAQAQGLGRLAYIAVESLQGFAHQYALHFLDAELFQVLALLTLLHVEPEIGDLDLSGLTHQHGTLQRVFQLAHIAGPAVLHHGLQSSGGKAVDRNAIP